MWVDMPVILSSELAVKSCHVSNKAEMVEAGGGRKGESLGKDRGLRGGKGMAGEFDDGGNLGRVGIVSMGVVGWLVWGMERV